MLITVTGYFTVFLLKWERILDRRQYFVLEHSNTINLPQFKFNHKQLFFFFFSSNRLTLCITGSLYNISNNCLVSLIARLKNM